MSAASGDEHDGTSSSGSGDRSHRDYYTTAQQEAFSKKVNAAMAMDNRKQAAANGERTKMRELMGSTEYQELVLK